MPDDPRRPTDVLLRHPTIQRNPALTRIIRTCQDADRFYALDHDTLALYMGMLMGQLLGTLQELDVLRDAQATRQ
jgi:hypothetical protein